MSTPYRNIILDGDPGADDLVAWLVACGSPELNILGLCTVYGNVPINITTENALNFSSLIRKQIPVFPGAEKPLCRQEHRQDSAHGSNGLGKAVLLASSQRAEKKSAHSFIIDSVREHHGQGPGGRVTVVATGPLTNVAKAIIEAPDIVGKLDQLVIMGGAFHKQGKPGAQRIGNITEYAEFNWHNDPEAAQVIVESGGRVAIIPLDVTGKIISTPQRLAEVRRSVLKRTEDKSLSENIVKLLSSGEVLDRSKFGVDGAFLNDPTAVLYLLRPDLFVGKRCSVEVEVTGAEANLGQSIISNASTSPRVDISLGLQIDAEDLLYNLMIERIIRGLNYGIVERRNQSIWCE